MNHLELFEQKISQKFKRMQTQKTKSAKINLKKSLRGEMASSMLVEGAKSIKTPIPDELIWFDSLDNYKNNNFKI